MRNPLTSLDLYFLVRELKRIKNSYIEKIWSIDREYYVIKIRGEKEKGFICYKQPGLLWMSRTKPASSMLTSFAQLLRSRIERKKILEIKQIRSERIVEFLIEDDYKLVIELIPPGNMLLLKNDVIEGALYYKEWGKRTIRKGEKYSALVSIDYLNMEKEELMKQLSILVEKTRNNAKALALLGLGGIYGEEIVARSRVEKEDLRNESRIRIIEEFLKLKDTDTRGFIYGEEAFPIRLITLGDPDKTYNTFSEAIEELVSREVRDPELERLEKELKALEKNIEEQREALSLHEEEAEKNRKIGELIYEHYQEIEALLGDYKKGLALEDLKEKHKILKEIRKGILIIELD